MIGISGISPSRVLINGDHWIWIRLTSLIGCVDHWKPSCSVRRGVYIVGVTSFVFMVTGAWLLLVGIESDQASRKPGNPDGVASLVHD